MSVSLRRSDWARIAFASVLALVALVVVSGLGLWQYGRAHRDDITRQVLAASPVPVQSLVQPAAYVPESVFGHAVTVTGTLVGARALMSCGRLEPACIVFAPVRVNGTPEVTVVTDACTRDACEQRMAAIRGAGDQDVDLSGRLQPAETMTRPSSMVAPADMVPFINTNDLVMRWGTALFDGFVVKDGVDIALVTPPAGVSWRNLTYAWQWWAFAAFIVFLLARYIIDVRADSIAESGRSSWTK